MPESLEYLETTGALTVEQGATVRRLIESHRRLLIECRGGSLLHGDLGLTHVWADPAQGRLTSIVDFGERSAGDTVWDFAEFDPQHVPALLAGYEPEEDLREAFATKLRFYKLVRAIPWAHKWHQRGETHVIDWLKLMIKTQASG